MAEEPSIWELLRGDIRDLRKDVGDRFDKVVTREAFEAEQKRRDEQHAQLGRDLVAEREARILGDKSLEEDIDAATTTAKAAKEAQESRKITFRQGLTLALISALAAGVVGLIVLIIQNAAHLGA